MIYSDVILEVPVMKTENGTVVWRRRLTENRNAAWRCAGMRGKLSSMEWKASGVGVDDIAACEWIDKKPPTDSLKLMTFVRELVKGSYCSESICCRQKASSPDTERHFHLQTAGYQRKQRPKEGLDQENSLSLYCQCAWDFANWLVTKSGTDILCFAKIVVVSTSSNLDCSTGEQRGMQLLPFLQDIVITPMRWWVGECRGAVAHMPSAGLEVMQIKPKKR